MKKQLLFLAIICLSFANSGLITAQTTVNWPLKRVVAPSDSLAPSPVSGTGFYASDISFSSSLTTVNCSSTFGSDGTAYSAIRTKGLFTSAGVYSSSGTYALPPVFTTDTYEEFTITPATNYQLTVSSVDMYLAGGGTASVYAQIKYSTDGFTTSTPLDAGTSALAQNSSTAITHKSFSSLTINVPAGSTFKVRVYPKYTGSASTTKYLVTSNVNITFTATAATNPNIGLTSGANPTTVTETNAMTPVIYTYSNVTNDADVVGSWYTDNTYTTTTTAPSGLSIVQDATAKTFTVSGTPTTGTAGTYYYAISVGETSGNTVKGSVVINSGSTTGIATVSLSEIKYDGQTIFNPDHTSISLFDISGRLIAISINDINLTGKPNGIYIVKIGDKNLKIIYSK